jgi:hypothetical protein
MAFGDGELEHTLQETWVRGVERYSSCQETENIEDVTKLEISVRTTSRAFNPLSVLPLLRILSPEPSAYHSTSRGPIGDEDFRQQRCLHSLWSSCKDEAAEYSLSLSTQR